MDHEHAKEAEACRQTLADFLALMLRDEVDIVTGDFNQASKFLGEVMTNVVDFYEEQTNTRPHWLMPLPHEEIRTIFINWPMSTRKLFTLPYVSPVPQTITELRYTLCVKQQVNFQGLTAEDFGISPEEVNLHLPSFYMARKSPTADHNDLHQRSVEGQRRDNIRRRAIQKAKRRTRALEYNRRTVKPRSQLTGIGRL